MTECFKLTFGKYRSPVKCWYKEHRATIVPAASTDVIILLWCEIMVSLLFVLAPEKKDPIVKELSFTSVSSIDSGECDTE